MSNPKTSGFCESKNKVEVEVAKTAGFCESKNKVEVEVAKTAGFCFGVNRAINKVYSLLEQGKRVCTLGPIIHNPQIVEDLCEKGVVVISKVDDTPKGYILVIRAHGVAESVLNEIANRGLKFEDATCPCLKPIYNYAKQAEKENHVFILTGDKNHPEVIGVMGHCEGEKYVVKNHDELEVLIKNQPLFEHKTILIAAQTTFNQEEWQNCLKSLKKLCTKVRVFDTICNATAKRQAEARVLAQKSDIMVVIGGNNSSNSAKLREICADYCPTYFIERPGELPKIQGNYKIGITAGASTPASIIKEVLVTMTEMNQNAEQNFEEMLEESLKSLNTDEKVRGVVVGISPTEVYVDVGRKQAGFIPLSELSQDPGVRPEDIVKMGDEMDLLIMKTNDQEGTIMLSKRRIDAMKGWDDIEAAQESQEILTGRVIEIVKGGLIVLSRDMRLFIPASQATANRGDDLNELKNLEVKFRIIEVNRQRRRAVGSIRSVLREERKAAQEKFWSEVQEGDKFTGKVKSLTTFGVFVDLGGVDGMVHISELSWSRIKHPSEVLTVGDTVNVYIKGVDRENGKISLGYKNSEDNPWEILKQDYSEGTVCDVTVVGMTQFGAFANIIPGIDGLIHISQIADHRIEKPQDLLKVGDVVKAKITSIDFDKHRVSLSIRALLEEEKAAQDAAAEGSADELVYISGEETANEVTSEPSDEKETETDSHDVVSQTVEEPSADVTTLPGTADLETAKESE